MSASNLYRVFLKTRVLKLASPQAKGKPATKWKDQTLWVLAGSRHQCWELATEKCEAKPMYGKMRRRRKAYEWEVRIKEVERKA